MAFLGSLHTHVLAKVKLLESRPTQLGLFAASSTLWLTLGASSPKMSSSLFVTQTRTSMYNSWIVSHFTMPKIRCLITQLTKLFGMFLSQHLGRSYHCPHQGINRLCPVSWSTRESIQSSVPLSPSYSQSLRTAIDCGYWDVDIIPEDWHHFLKCWFRAMGTFASSCIFIHGQRRN